MKHALTQTQLEKSQLLQNALSSHHITSWSLAITLEDNNAGYMHTCWPPEHNHATLISG